MSYIGTEPKDIRSFGRTKFDYTATQGQTAFTGADDDGKILAFTTGQIEVYVNGILMDDSDFTTTGTGTVTLASAANLNDVINIVSFESNIPDNDYVPASGGTFTGALTTGALTIDGAVNVNNNHVNIDSGYSYQWGDSHERIEQSDGKIEFFTNNGEQMTLSGSNLGLGTTSPVSNSNYATLTISNTTGGQTHYKSTGGSVTAYIGADSSSSGVGYLATETNHPLLFRTNNTERMRVDSSGNVTMPNQPCFAATRSQGHVGQNTDYVFPNVYHNRGNHYNSSNGRFTAPVAGMYQVNVNMMDISAATHTNRYYDIRKNGSTYQLAYNSNPTSGSHHRWSWSGIIEMAASDYINIYSGNVGLYGGANEYTHFSAALLN